jgi:hypothetical protein
MQAPFCANWDAPLDVFHSSNGDATSDGGPSDGPRPGHDAVVEGIAYQADGVWCPDMDWDCKRPSLAIPMWGKVGISGEYWEEDCGELASPITLGNEVGGKAELLLLYGE